MNFSDLTLVIPAKEETNCLFHVLEELQNFDIEKIIIIPNDHNFPNNMIMFLLQDIKKKKKVMMTHSSLKLVIIFFP